MLLKCFGALSHVMVKLILLTKYCPKSRKERMASPVRYALTLKSDRFYAGYLKSKPQRRIPIASARINPPCLDYI